MSIGNEFRVGERVRIVEDPVRDVGLYRRGWTGTIINGAPGARKPAVEFDPGFSADLGTNPRLGAPPPGRCRWYVEVRCLQLIPSGPVDYKQFDEGGVV